MHQPLTARLLALYETLDAHFGHEPHWWPIVTADPPFETLVGAVLVQQTRWETVEAAVLRLRDRGLMQPAALAAADPRELAELIRPCAFHTQKAPGLQAIARHLVEHYGGAMAALLRGERAAVRAELLALPRIGRETADTVMLYGGTHAPFIVDAYARRLLARLDLAPGYDALRAPYDALQAVVEAALPAELLPLPAREFHWRLHALIVEACIHHCLARRPRCARPGLRRAFVDDRKCAAHCRGCDGCPLREGCATFLAGVAADAANVR